MAIKENLLSVISSIQSGDFLRLVTSDGASRKASISNVGKWLVENYEGSTLIGTTRTVQDAINTVHPYITGLTVGTSISDFIRTNLENGKLPYNMAFNARLSGPYIFFATGIFYKLNDEVYGSAIVGRPNYICKVNCNHNVWTEELVTSQPSVSGLSQITGTYRLSSGADASSLSFEVPANSRHLLTFIGPYSSRGHAVYTVACNTTGQVYAVKIGGTADFPDTVTGTGNALTITRTGTDATYCAIEDMVISGTAITLAT